MCIALIGGMNRLQRHYKEEALREGIEPRMFNCSEINMGPKLKNVDAVVIFTKKVSHRAKNKAVKEARANGIPVLMHHSCGVCTLRSCLGCLLGKEGLDAPP